MRKTIWVTDEHVNLYGSLSATSQSDDLIPESGCLRGLVLTVLCFPFSDFIFGIDRQLLVLTSTSQLSFLGTLFVMPASDPHFHHSVL